MARDLFQSEKTWDKGEEYDKIQSINCKIVPYLNDKRLECMIGHSKETIEGQGWRYVTEYASHIFISARYKYHTNLENDWDHYRLKIEFMPNSYARCRVTKTPDGGITLLCEPDWETVARD